MKIISETSNFCYYCNEPINYYYLEDCICHQYIHDNCLIIVRKLYNKCLICQQNYKPKNYFDMYFFIKNCFITIIKILNYLCFIIIILIPLFIYIKLFQNK